MCVTKRQVLGYSQCIGDDNDCGVNYSKSSPFTFDAHLVLSQRQLFNLPLRPP